jgi:hypothetical protein
LRSIPTPASTHIFAVAGTLRVPLSQPQKRHIPPERYAQYALKMVGKFCKIIKLRLDLQKITVYNLRN